MHADDGTRRTWLITGASRGLGLAFAQAALKHGDRVVAAARRPQAVVDQLARYDDRAHVVTMDVNERSAVDAAVDEAIEWAGHLDVVVNNAGYGLSGGVEEVTEAQLRAQFDTNFFGATWVTRAVLPHLRARRSGHIIQISSMAGVIAAPNLGVYCASKWALEAMSEALAAEVAPFGIKVTIVEPGGFRTDWSGGSMDRATALADYDEVLSASREALSGSRVQPGDPERAAQALLTLVAADNPPLRLPLGDMAINACEQALRGRLASFVDWADVSRSVDAPAAS